MTVSRQLKQRILSQPQVMEVRAEPGLVMATRNELESIFATPLVPLKFVPTISQLSETKIRIENVGVRTIIELLCRCRTPRYLHWVLDEKEVQGFGELKKFLDSTPLSLLFPSAALIGISVYTKQSRLNHRIALLKCLGEFLTGSGFLPQDAVSGKTPFHVSLSIDQNRCQLRVHLTPRELFRRGYKTLLSARAPLGEHIAAALTQKLDEIFPANSNHQLKFVPFSGTGTFCWEGLLTEIGISNLCFGTDTTVTKLNIDAEPTLNHIKKQLRMSTTAPISRWVLLDNDPSCKEACEQTEIAFKRNLGSNVKLVETIEADFFTGHYREQLKAPFTTVYLNPPFDDRLEITTTPTAFYEKILDSLGQFSSNGVLRGLMLCPEDAKFHWPSGWRHELISLRSGGKPLKCHFFSRP